MNVLVTGASGFLGNSIVNYLSKNKSLKIFCGYRYKKNQIETNNLIPVCLGDFSAGKIKWPNHVKIDLVIHTVAINDNKGNNLRKINIEATEDLVKKSIKNCVNKFIFLSSIKVYGETHLIDKGLTESTIPKPESLYAVSKLEAEEKIKKLVNSTKSSMKYIIVRLPLVYGPGVKGNFQTLISLILKSKLILPFGNIQNKKSFLAIDNLIGFINFVLRFNHIKNEIFCISDDEIISSTTLMKRIINVFGVKIKLISIPQNILVIISSLIFKKKIVDSVYGNLYVDISKVKNELKWKPSVNMINQLKKIKDAKIF